MESDKFTIGFLSSVTSLALPLNNSRDVHEERLVDVPPLVEGGFVHSDTCE